MAAVSTDPAALYARHRAWLLARCASRLRSRTDAEDAVQQTFVYALACLERGVVPRDEGAWLRAIADNVCRAARRGPSGRETGLDVELLPAPEAGEATARELATALAELPPGQRRALLLREWQGLSYREIAASLGTSESAVETLLVRARRRAAALIADGRRALDLGSILSTLRSLLATAAGKAGAVGIAGAIAAGATATALPHLERHARPRRDEPPLRGTLSLVPPSHRFSSSLRPRPAASARRTHEAIRSRPVAPTVAAAAPRAAPVAPAAAPPREAGVPAATTATTPAAAGGTTTAPAAPAPAAAPAPTPTAPAPAAVTTTAAADVTTLVSGAAAALPGTVGGATQAVSTTASTATQAVSTTASTATQAATGAVATVTGALPPLPQP